MKSYLKSRSSYVTGSGKAHSPRTSAGRSTSSAWVVPARSVGATHVSSEQQLSTGRSSTAAMSHARRSARIKVKDGEVAGGPPGGSISGGGGRAGGGSGGRAGGGDRDGDGGEQNRGPGTPWWLYCIQAVAAGWAAGCVIFEAGHLLHHPVPPVRSLPPSAKMGLARTSVVQMQYDRFQLSWIWVLLAALGTVAVMLSCKRGDFEKTEEQTEIEEEEHVQQSDLDVEQSDAEAVASRNSEWFQQRISSFTVMAMRTQSAPLPDVPFLTCHDNTSFHEPQRFWASGGAASPRSSNGDAVPMLPCPEAARTVQKRSVSLDSRQKSQRAEQEAPDISRGSADPPPALHLQLPTPTSQHESDAPSWPSTPHTPDLKVDPSSDLEALGHQATAVGVSMKDAKEAGGKARRAAHYLDVHMGSKVPKNASSLSEMGQDTQQHQARGCSYVESCDEVADVYAHAVDEASVEVFDQKRFEGGRHMEASEASCMQQNIPNADIVAAVVDEDFQVIKPQASASSTGKYGLLASVGVPVPSTAPATSSVAENCDRGSLQIDNQRHVPEMHSAPGDLSNLTVVDGGGCKQACQAAHDDHPGPAGFATWGHASAGLGQPYACSRPPDQDHVQVPTTLNLRSLPPQAIKEVPKFRIMSGELSEIGEPAKALISNAPLSERSCIKGGLDTSSSTMFPQQSWQIADEVEVVAKQSNFQKVAAASYTSDVSSDSDSWQPATKYSSGGRASDVSFGSSGSPSFMSFPSQQNQFTDFHWG